MGKKQLLVNWVYYRPVGHVVEALIHTYGYYVPNRERVQISLLLNAASPVELARACPWIHQVFPVSLDEVCAAGEEAPCLRRIPRNWDYVIADPRTQPESMVPGWDEDDLIATQTVLHARFRAREWQGFSQGWRCRWDTEGLLGEDTPLLYAANARLTLPVPPGTQRFLRHNQTPGPSICILPGGSAGQGQSPSPAVWHQICRALLDHIPNLRIYVTGISAETGGRTSTLDFSLQDMDALAQQIPGVTNCFDIGLWNQIALMADCDLLCSPHTGFAFLSQLVHTPWLVLSGCPWEEYCFNGTPFYSVLPDCASYPAQGQADAECNLRLEADRKAVCMEDERVIRRIPELVQGARRLLDPSFTYAQACRLHIQKLRSAGRNPRQFRFCDWSD